MSDIKEEIKKEKQKIAYNKKTCLKSSFIKRTQIGLMALALLSGPSALYSVVKAEHEDKKAREIIYTEEYKQYKNEIYDKLDEFTGDTFISSFKEAVQNDVIVDSYIRDNKIEPYYGHWKDAKKFNNLYLSFVLSSVASIAFAMPFEPLYNSYYKRHKDSIDNAKYSIELSKEKIKELKKRKKEEKDASPEL